MLLHYKYALAWVSEERWRCRGTPRVTLAWNGFHSLVSFFPSVPFLFVLFPPSTLPISFLPLLTPILQIKPRTTPTNDANGPDVSRRPCSALLQHLSPPLVTPMPTRRHRALQHPTLHPRRRHLPQLQIPLGCSGERVGIRLALTLR